jgi:HEAT repeat protein
VITFLTWCSVALAAAGALSVCVLAVRRVVVARAERRRSEAEGRLRPLALALLDGDDVDLAGLSARDADLLAALLRRYGRSLRGDDTARIAAFFDAGGWVDRQLANLSRRTAWRRATAGFTLGDMGSPRAVPALTAALRDDSPDVRAAAARSLGVLGAADAVEPLVYALAERRIPRSVAGQALLAIGPAALPALRELETAPEAEARAFAVELVGLLGTPADGVRLVERLRDSSAEVRAKAARSLGRLGARQGTSALRDALQDRIPFVRVAAAGALGVIGDADAVPELLRVARSDAFDPARAAARTAAQLAPELAATELSPHVQEALDLLGVGS